MTNMAILAVVDEGRKCVSALPEDGGQIAGAKQMEVFNGKPIAQSPFIVEQVERNLLCPYGKNGSG